MEILKGFNKINFNEQFKIRPRRNASIKHEIIKTLIVINLIEKYKDNTFWIRVYTEHALEDGKICDVYFENIKTKEIICYEIQKTISDKWIKETTEFYNNFDRMFFSTDWCLVKEKELSDNLEELNNQIRELII